MGTLTRMRTKRVIKLRATKEREIARRRRRRITLAVAGVIALGAGLPYLVNRPPEPPPGFAVTGAPCAVTPADVRVLIDSTAFDTNRNERVIQQGIFDAILQMVDGAQSFICADFFLWNPWQGSVPEEHRRLAGEFADALIRKKQKDPDITIVVLTDPINRVYGQDELSFHARLREAGAIIVFTDLARLADPNTLYAGPAETYGRLLTRIPAVRRRLDRRRIANPLTADSGPITGWQKARLLHFKANHRKVIITDSGDGGMKMIVTSFNPADGSSAHSNIGLLLAGDAAATALGTELDCIEWSSSDPDRVLEREPGDCAKALEAIRAHLGRRSAAPEPADDEPFAEWLTEGAIREKVLALLDRAGPGDEVRIGMFYLSDRGIVKAVKDAAYGGARVRVLLDPNRDAFGRVKNGVPNRCVGAELATYGRAEEKALTVRWADTHGEQFHTKAISITNPEAGRYHLLCGSANWTRRNIGNFNLEASVHLGNEPEAVRAFNQYFDRAWSNSDGLSHSVPYDAFAESGWTLFRKTIQYRFQEATGMCTF